MSQRVQASAGQTSLLLPDGWVLNGGDTVVISDETWALVQDDPDLSSALTDLGTTSEVPDPVPTWRDIQQATRTSDTGLATEVDALQTALGVHVADTTAVHGIADTSKLAWNQQVAAAGALDKQALRFDIATSLWKPQPDPGTGYSAVVNFATPLQVWSITHNQGTYAITVETFTNDDEPIEGNVRYPSLNVIEVDFYYAQSGYARLWGN